jgi:hypothetical protein
MRPAPKSAQIVLFMKVLLPVQETHAVLRLLTGDSPSTSEKSGKGRSALRIAAC